MSGQQNIRLLLAVSLPQYRIFTVKHPVKDVADVTGLKLRSTGGAQDLTLRALGAVPVRMAAPDAYESLSRGTMDGLPEETSEAHRAEILTGLERKWGPGWRAAAGLSSAAFPAHNTGSAASWYA